MALRIFAAAAFAFLYIPIITLVVYSFSEARYFTFPPVGFSFKWYVTLFEDRELLQSVRNSLIVTGIVVPATLALGIPAAFAIDRFDFPGKAIFERVVLLPLMVPGVITGLAILLVIKGVDMRLSLTTVAIGHTVGWLPIVVTQVYARLRRFDRRLEEASMDLGGNRRQTFLRITLPGIKNAIIGSALLVFTLSFDEIGMTFFLTGTQNTLPMFIWSMLREGVSPEINAVATITIAISIVLIVVGLRFLGKEKD
ncbi:MAG: ABC transporter permease [Dongiaceae bacterium]